MHSVSILIVTLLVDMIYVRSLFLELSLLGLGVTFLANIYRIYTSKNKFLLDSLFVFWIAINSLGIWIIKLILNALGATDLIISSIIIAVGLVGTSYLVNYLHLVRLRGLKKGLLIIFLFLVLFFGNQGFFIQTQTSTNESDNINLTSGNFLANIVDSIKSTFSKTLNANCPQINVPIKEDWRGLNIKGQSYDDWSIKGDATCRKGTKEGENLNKYYCGGYTSFFVIGDVNAYVEKTTISETGDIGKTYKYVIWNIYDEDKNFVETRCIGDPDKFDQKQAEAFERELLKWN